MHQMHDPDAIIAIGSLIQGETRHFEFVSSAVAHGIAELNVRLTSPVIFCVLTDDHIDQARDRSGGKHGNKGVEAAVAALRMARLGT
jgi:6,7-dimethyl-8-ribityllumazine synthase